MFILRSMGSPFQARSGHEQETPLFLERNENRAFALDFESREFRCVCETSTLEKCELQSRRDMASANTEKSALASMNGTAQKLSPCLRLFIEVLLNEAIHDERRSGC
jgi:hypothetical protein